MFKFNYAEKLGRFKQTAVTSFRLLGLLWQFDKGLLTANAAAVTIPAITPFVYAYIFKLVIDQVVAVVGGSSLDFNFLAQLMLATFTIYMLQSLSFSAQDFLYRLLYTKKIRL